MSKSETDIDQNENNSIDYEVYSKISDQIDDAVFDTRNDINDEISECSLDDINAFMRTYKYLMECINITEFIEKIGTFSNAKVFLIIISTGLEEYIPEMTYQEVLMYISMYVRDVYNIDWDIGNKLESADMKRMIAKKQKDFPGDVELPEDEEDLEATEVLHLMDYSISEGYEYNADADNSSDDESNDGDSNDDDSNDDDSDEEIEGEPTYSFTVKGKDVEYVWVKDIKELTVRMKEKDANDEERNFVVSLLDGSKTMEEIMEEIIGDDNIVNNSIYFLTTSRPSSKIKISLYDNLIALREASKWLSKTNIDKEDVLSNKEIKKEFSKM